MFISISLKGNTQTTIHPQNPKIKKTTQMLNEDIEQLHPCAEYTHPVPCLVSTVSDSLDPVDCVARQAPLSMGIL